MQGKFDYGRQSHQHREMIILQMLTLWGLTAQIFAPVVFNNDYDIIAPEVTEAPVPIGTTEVLLSQPTKGFRLSDFISLADKVEDYINVTSLVSLPLESQLWVTFPDNKTMNLRIIEALVQHPLSTIGYNYKAVVT
jgi:hypothetical protein